MKWERDCEEMTMCVTKGRELADSGWSNLKKATAVSGHSSEIDIAGVLSFGMSPGSRR
jgi:hypothetical protein